jgi:hypothetical protein
VRFLLLRAIDRTRETDFRLVAHVSIHSVDQSLAMAGCSGGTGCGLVFFLVARKIEPSNTKSNSVIAMANIARFAPGFPAITARSKMQPLEELFHAMRQSQAIISAVRLVIGHK